MFSTPEPSLQNQPSEYGHSTRALKESYIFPGHWCHRVNEWKDNSGCTVLCDTLQQTKEGDGGLLSFPSAVTDFLSDSTEVRELTLSDPHTCQPFTLTDTCLPAQNVARALL